MEIPNSIEIDVVNIHMVTKTMPILSTIPCVPRILQIIKPIIAKKIGILNQRFRMKDGIRLNLLILPSQKSLKLPRGQRFPQNHLPLKGLMIMRQAKTSSKK